MGITRALRWLLMAALWSVGVAHAFPPDLSDWNAPHKPLQFKFKTAMEGCKDSFPTITFDFSEPGPTVLQQSCHSTTAGGGLGTVYRKATCPTGSTLVGNECKRDSACKKGEEYDLLFKIGWANFYSGRGGTIDLDGGGSVTPLPPIQDPPGDICYQGCSAYMTVKKDQYVDKAAMENGNVPILQDATYYETGESCKEGKPNTDLAGPPPPPHDPGCTGPNCGTSPGGGNDKPPAEPPKKPGAGPDKPGHQDQGPGGGGGPKPGNSDNDAKPVCGVEGKPACTTRIDESGTPTDAGGRMGTEGLNNEWSKKDSALDRIRDASDKNTGWGATPGWFASGQCQPMSFGDFMGVDLRIDHCVAMPYARAVSTFLWVVVTFFAITGMVSRTVGAGARS